VADLTFSIHITCSGPVYPVNILGTMHCIAYLIIVNPISVRVRGARALALPLEINSGKLKIIRALNLVKIFLEITLILKKRGKF